MTTRLGNDNDPDGATYQPPVQNEPVERLLECMVGCDPEYEYAAMLTREQEAAMAVAAQMNLLKKVTEMCSLEMQRMALTPGQQETPSQEPRPHLTTYLLASGASKSFIMNRIVPLALQASARSWLGLRAPFTRLADFQTRLREEFLPAGYATQILREPEARTQHPDESLDRYVRVMQELFKRADPNTPESDRVARVRRQCHPRYHAYLINRTFETPEELARGARLIEQALHAERNYVPQPPAKYAVKPACPEASTQVDCPNETSLPHHINRESPWNSQQGPWWSRAGVATTSGKLLAVPYRKLGPNRDHYRSELSSSECSCECWGKLACSGRNPGTPAATKQALPTTANRKPGRGLPLVVLYLITGGGPTGTSVRVT
ncbi:hypothetical protein ISCGN_030815 [Ixodes scapularis]